MLCHLVMGLRNRHSHGLGPGKPGSNLNESRFFGKTTTRNTVATAVALDVATFIHVDSEPNRRPVKILLPEYFS